MNKTEIVNAVAASTGQTVASAKKSVDAVFETIREALVVGDTVSVAGFGFFSVRQRAARTGVNPRQPSQKIQIPASKSPAFKPAKALKEAVN